MANSVNSECIVVGCDKSHDILGMFCPRHRATPQEIATLRARVEELEADSRNAENASAVLLSVLVELKESHENETGISFTRRNSAWSSLYCALDSDDYLTKPGKRLADMTAAANGYEARSEDHAQQLVVALARVEKAEAALQLIIDFEHKRVELPKGFNEDCGDCAYARRSANISRNMCDDHYGDWNRNRVLNERLVATQHIDMTKIARVALGHSRPPAPHSKYCGEGEPDGK